jgi:hypothetical protein
MVEAEAPRYPADRTLRWRRPLVALAGGALACVGSRVLARMPDLVERVYTGGIWPLLSRPLSLLTGLLPVALGELLLVACMLWLTLLFGRAVNDAVRRRRRWRNALAGGLHRVARDSGIIVMLFYVLWGFNYARPPFAARAGWPAWAGADAGELAALAAQAVDASNQAYLAIHGTADAGVPTALPADTRALEAAIDEGWVRAARLLSLPPIAAAPFGRAKWPWTTLLQRFGILGAYFPFTAEANLPRGLPAMSVPATMAHEKAHQRGSTSEAEAGFLGFVASALAPHPLSRYSAAMSARSQLLTGLFAVDPAAARRIGAQLLPGPRRDIAALRDWFGRYNSFVMAVGSALNDRYLRANRVRGGTDDYARAAWLLVGFARQHDGALLPQTEGLPAPAR